MIVWYQDRLRVHTHLQAAQSYEDPDAAPIHLEMILSGTKSWQKFVHLILSPVSRCLWMFHVFFFFFHVNAHSLCVSM